MRARSIWGSAVAVAVAFALSACGSTDSPVSPTAQRPTPAPNASNSLILGAPTTITPLLRTTGLASPITVSKTIGILGGMLAVPQAGLLVVVPPLAVASPTNFQVTALAGSKLAYEFEPHGTRFNVPLVMTQDLHNTQVQAGLVNPLAVSLGYFPNSANNTSVTELLGVNVNLLNLTAVSTIWHFSGYIYAGGCDSDGF